MFTLHKKVRGFIKKQEKMQKDIASARKRNSHDLARLAKRQFRMRLVIQGQASEISQLKCKLTNTHNKHRKPKQLSLHVNSKPSLAYVPTIGGPRMLDALYDHIRHPNIKAGEICKTYNIGMHLFTGKIRAINARAANVGVVLNQSITSGRFRTFISSYRRDFARAMAMYFKGSSVAAGSKKYCITESALIRALSTPRAIKVLNARHHTHYKVVK